MDTEILEYEKKQEDLLEQYFQKGNSNLLRKILNLNPVKKKMKAPIRDQQINPIFFKPRCFKSSNAIVYDSNPLRENIRNFDLHYDPEYKDKQMKGNTKWASQKFYLMKLNMAKRYRTPIDAIPFHKIEQSHGKSQVINGNMLLKIDSNEKRTNHLKPLKHKVKKIDTKEEKTSKEASELPILHTNTCKF